eukprot:4823919-Amphidinium_carterae.1
MSGHDREKAFAGIAVPADLYCPWIHMPTPTESHATRNILFGAFRPAVDRRGPHSVELYFVLAFRSHLVDPAISRVYSLVTLLGRMAAPATNLVQQCYDANLPPFGAASVLAAWLRGMPGNLRDEIFHHPWGDP